VSPLARPSGLVGRAGGSYNYHGFEVAKSPMRLGFLVKYPQWVASFFVLALRASDVKTLV
jgi:hypothetical protein